MEKRCFKCQQVKPLEGFYKHPQMEDGHLNKCKECTKADVRNHYYAHRLYWAAYYREREQRPERKAARRRYAKNFRAKWPEKRRAHIAVGNAIRDGKLIKSPCEVCGSPDVHGHHDDYSKPLDVRWLCNAHHVMAHGKLPAPRQQEAA